MTTVHGKFFSNSNKEYVSTAVFQNVKEELGVELDATFVENLMKIMAETYSNNERPKNMEINEYVSFLNEKVVQQCLEKVKTSASNVDYKKISQRAAEERNYDFAKKPIQKHQEKEKEKEKEQEKEQEQEKPKKVYTQQYYQKKDNHDENMTIILDFRKDLIDVDNKSYCLKLHKEANITCIILKKFMIELCDTIVSEPYIFVDIENINDNEKSCFVENKKVIGRMVQQTSTICNKTMYLYDQEDCKIELKNPIKTNHLYFSFYNYNGEKLDLKKINLKKVIKIEKSELNQLITEGINIVKPGENITVTTVSKTKDKKGEYWECSPLKINETKSNSIICSQLPSMEQGSKMLLEKKILNSNISLAIFYKN
jgi:hypothetical protein